jgi:ribosomal protein S18 acetylase RimI-like enzyme
MMTIRDYSSDDAPALAPLLDELGHPCAAEELRRRVSRLRKGAKGDRILVAADGEGIVGLLALHFTPVLHRETDVGRVTVLVVASRARRRGIGALLMAQAERIARRAGAARLELTSGHDRAGAHELYRSLGFRDEGVRFAKPIEHA